MKYTKGPWRACHNGDCPCHMVWSIPHDCVVGVGIGAKDEDYTGGEGIANESIVAANTRLIAAAPDMYEALKAVDDYLSSNYPDNMKLKQIAVNKLVSALAKAEGKGE